jgi:CRISPR-associated protein Csb2
MTSHLCISVTFLDSLFHGKCDGNEPEWPPSPLRLFQALLRGTRTGCRNSQWSEAKAKAFRWLEECEPPEIVAPQVTRASSYTSFVPNNDSDKEFNRQNRLTSKVVSPYRLPDELENRTLHYLWCIDTENDSTNIRHAKLLCAEAHHLLALGWGIDQAVAYGRTLTKPQMLALNGIRWRPLTAERHPADARRIPAKGTLRNLEEVHESFVSRVNGKQYTPSLKPSVFRRIQYVSPDHVSPDFVAKRHYALFELRNQDGSFFRYPQRKLIHIAGMVRHLAIELMKSSPPRDVDDEWVRTYIAGHARPGSKEHRQLSYLPLPSIGHKHTDPSVRRVMIAAPLGDDRLLHHLARLLAGQRLKPTSRTRLDHPPTLVRVRRDNVARLYTKPAVSWASVTPVILPGHDDHKPEKTRKLIAKALQQSGIDQPCKFEWNAFSHFPKLLSAHKYDRDKKPTGYIRSDHLLTQTAVHLKLCFNDDLKVPGPLVIGAGRHCGLGLLAGIDR